jgi:hypothetical protein
MAISPRTTEKTRAEYHAEGTARLERMKESGKGIPEDEVFNYLSDRVQGKSAVRPKVRKIV